MPALCADAGEPDTLVFAGLLQQVLPRGDRPHQRRRHQPRGGHRRPPAGPALPALCRAERRNGRQHGLVRHPAHHQPLRKVRRVHGPRPHSPAAYHLLLWLTGLPGTTITRHREPPAGKWVLCGYGAFGRVMTQALEGAGLPVTIIDRARRSTPATPGSGRRHRRGSPAGPPASPTRWASWPPPPTT